MQAIVLDATILNTVQACPLKAKYSFVDNLKPLTSPSYFDKGSLFHDMARFYRMLRKHRSPWGHNKMLELCVRLGRRNYIKLDLAITDCEEVVEYFVHYANKFASDGWVFLTIERPFFKEMFRNDEVVIFYQGKPDATVRIPNFQDIVVDDIKTGSRDTQPELLSNQFLGYAWAMDTQTIIIDKINFYERADLKKAFQDKKFVDKAFKRYVRNYPKELVAEWVQNTIYWALEWRKYLESGIFPANYTSCDKYSGCMFAKTSSGTPGLCESEPAARQFKMLSDYKKGKPWDVGKILKP